MRILVISDLPQFVTGGAEKQAANLIEAWMDADHEVICFGRRMGRDLVRVGRHEVAVRRIATLQRFGRLLRGVSYLFSLTKLLLEHRRCFDVIYTRFLGEAALTVSLLKRMHLLNVALVATPASTGSNGGDMSLFAGLGFRRQLVHLLNTQCDAINLIAPAMVNELIRIGFSRGSFAHIPNGVVVQHEPPAHSDRPHWAVTVGRIAPQKGYDLLIKALANLPTPPPSGVLRIVGDGPERKKLMACAESLGVADAITWLGELDHTAVLGELDDARVFVLPSRYEGMSNAGLEAMERGLAVLITRCGGLDTYVEPDMGWTIPADDEDALANALGTAIGSPSESLSDMGQRNRAFALQHFDIQVIAARYVELFQRVIETRQVH